jgi:hypothetical protein
LSVNRYQNTVWSDPFSRAIYQGSPDTLTLQKIWMEQLLDHDQKELKIDDFIDN